MTDGAGIRTGAVRLSFVVDAAAYFRAVHEALRRARFSVFVLGWDIDSRTRLVSDGEAAGYPARLGGLLESIVEQRPDLRVHLLVWDYSTFYLPDREVLAPLRLGWMTSDRLRFAYDARHPRGSSHHQKVVVVDDALAFLGGMDLTTHRWDSPEHDPDDGRRRLPSGASYPPQHDVQVALSGPAATWLGEMARTRWHRAVDGDLPPVRPGHHDVWPESLELHLEDATVRIARTLPAYLDDEPVRETLESHLEAITEARRHVYIENQFLTSEAIVDALCRRLRDDDGPEIVVVTIRRSDDIIARAAMDVVRARQIARLEEADAHGRLGLLYPVHDGTPIYVHTKVTIADDAFLYVGSANITGRSMSLDSECGVVLEGDTTEKRRAISRLSERLIAEHLGVTAGAVAEAVDRERSLLGAIESLRNGPRTLRVLDDEVPEILEEAMPGNDLLDAEMPIGPHSLERPVQRDDGTTGSKSAEQGGWSFSETVRAAGLGIVLAGVIAVVLAWHLAPLPESMSVDRLAGWAAPFENSVLAPIVLIAIYGVVLCLGVPATLLVLATVLGFGPVQGGVYAWLGLLASALAGYGLGRAMGRKPMEKLCGRNLQHLTDRFAGGSILAVGLLRVVPVAPFAVVNMVAGATGIRLGPYAAGTMLGHVPGVVALALVGQGLTDALLDPGLPTYAVLAALIVAVAVTGYIAHRRLA